MPGIGLIIKASKTVLKNNNYWLITLVFSFIFFSIFVLVPVFSITGNSILFQLSIYTPSDYILLPIVSLLTGFNAAFQIYIFKQKKNISKSFASGAISSASGLFSAVVGTAACSACLASLFALFGIGFGGVIFILNYQTYFLTGAIVLLLATLYLSSRNIINITCVMGEENKTQPEYEK